MSKSNIRQRYDHQMTNHNCNQQEPKMTPQEQRKGFNWRTQKTPQVPIQLYSQDESYKFWIKREKQNEDNWVEDV